MKSLSEAIKDLTPEELAEIVKTVPRPAGLSQQHIFSRFPAGTKEVEWPMDEEIKPAKEDDRRCQPQYRVELDINPEEMKKAKEELENMPDEFWEDLSERIAKNSCRCSPIRRWDK